jgi:hypothetical protein
MSSFSKSDSENKVQDFLNDLREVLSKHKAILYGSDTELFIQSLGYVGFLEDNKSTIDIVEGDEIIYSSKIINN